MNRNFTNITQYLIYAVFNRHTIGNLLCAYLYTNIGVARATVLHEDHHQLEAISKPSAEVPSLSRATHCKLTLPPPLLGLESYGIFTGFWRQVE